MAEKSMKLTGKPVKNTPLVPADMLFILDSEDSDAIKRVPQTSFKGEKGDDGAPGPGISVKGSKDTVGDLPIGAEAGDAYVVRENGDLYISDGAENWAVADITGFVYKGSWDGATEYEPDDVVTYDGSAYFCILGENMGESPDDPGSIYWTLFLSKGADGSDGEATLISRNTTHLLKRLSGDPAAGFWSNPGTDVNGNFTSIKIDPSNGDGYFLSIAFKYVYHRAYGGFSDTILGVMTTDNNLSTIALAGDRLYVAGVKTIYDVDGITVINSALAMYDIPGAAWSAVPDLITLASVGDILVRPNGNVVVAGKTIMGDNAVFEYDGSTWTTLPLSFNGIVYTVTEGPDGTLYFTGLFSKVNGTISFNFAGYSPEGDLIPMSFDYGEPYHRPVADSSGRVYMHNKTGSDYVLYRWTTGVGWELILGGIGGYVILSLDAKRDILYAGGVNGFISIGGVSALNIAYCSIGGDGQWHPMTTGLTGSPVAIRDLLNSPFYGESLVVFGRFTDAGGVSVSNLALWTPGAVELVALSDITGEDGAPGEDGVDGASSYTAIAYADDDLGTGFTMTFDPSKDYIAIKTSAFPIPETPEQFAGLWKYYAGGSAPAVETAPEGLYTCDAGGSYGISLASAGTEYSLPLTEVIGDGLALGEYNDSVVVDSGKALFYRCLHNICGNITPDKACTLTLKLYQDDVLQRSRSLKVFDMGGGFAPVLAVLNYITENVTGGTEIMLTLSADIDDVWAEVEDLNHNMTFRQYTLTPEDELPEGAFLDEEGGAFIDEEGSFFIDGE